MLLYYWINLNCNNIHGISTILKTPLSYNIHKELIISTGFKKHFKSWPSSLADRKCHGYCCWCFWPKYLSRVSMLCMSHPWVHLTCLKNSLNILSMWVIVLLSFNSDLIRVMQVVRVFYWWMKHPKGMVNFWIWMLL